YGAASIYQCRMPRIHPAGDQPMTSEQKDVVERLLACAECEQAPLGPLLHDAADELTRLRAELDHEKKRRRAIDDEAFDYSEQVERLRAENAELRSRTPPAGM